tara:strand:+ start:1149 stop:1313 length:165 start_codon:yes stop_codon:yes gene_type:complete
MSIDIRFGTLLRIGLYAAIGGILATAGLTIYSWQLYAVLICVGLAIESAKLEGK